MTTLEDRRRKRSDDPLIALHYQLAHARHDGALEAIVLADSSGVVVAGAGSWATCEELAAYAPLLAQSAGEANESAQSPDSRMASLRLEVDVQSMTVDGQEVILCARGGALHTQSNSVMRGAMIARAAKGISRILQSSPVG